MENRNLAVSDGYGCGNDGDGWFATMAQGEVSGEGWKGNRYAICFKPRGQSRSGKTATPSLCRDSYLARASSGLSNSVVSWRKIGRRSPS